jgi:hypothetical protein
MTTRRFDFPPDHYPITIEALHPDTSDVVWSMTLEKPEDTALVRIPPLRKILGHPVMIRIRYATGRIQESEPLGGSN